MESLEYLLQIPVIRVGDQHCAMLAVKHEQAARGDGGGMAFVDCRPKIGELARAPAADTQVMRIRVKSLRYSMTG